MKKYQLPVWIVLAILLTACGEDHAAKEQAALKVKADAELQRQNTFTQFQGYTDEHFPGWKVISLNEDEGQYYVLLGKDGKKRVTSLVMMEFKKVDGTAETVIFPARIKADNKKKDDEEMSSDEIEAAYDDARADRDPLRH